MSDPLGCGTVSFQNERLIDVMLLDRRATAGDTIYATPKWRGFNVESIRDFLVLLNAKY